MAPLFTAGILFYLAILNVRAGKASLLRNLITAYIAITGIVEVRDHVAMSGAGTMSDTAMPSCCILLHRAVRGWPCSQVLPLALTQLTRFVWDVSRFALVWAALHNLAGKMSLLQSSYMLPHLPHSHTIMYAAVESQHD